MSGSSTPLHDEGYQRSLEIHASIEALYPRIEQYGAYFSGLMSVDPVIPRPPGRNPGVRLGPVVCALAIKAATTKRAILSLCELGDGHNALALTRVLLENACLLEWLIRGEGRRRLEAYVLFLSVQHERIVETVERHKNRFAATGPTPSATSDRYHRAIWDQTFQDAKKRRTKSHRPTWEFDRTTRKGVPVSVQELFKEIAAAEHSFEHDVLYGVFGSDIVHSGPFGLMSIQRLMGDRERYVLQPMPVSDTCTIALATSNSAMFLVLDSLTEYLGLDLSADLEQLKTKSKEDPYAT